MRSSTNRSRAVATRPGWRRSAPWRGDVADPGSGLGAPCRVLSREVFPPPAPSEAPPMMPPQRLSESAPDLFRLIREETRRQAEGLELIASENFVSPAVLEALGSSLTNKYAEGYPGKRYYGGCEVVDQVEQIAIDRAKKLFGADHANVQAHSGSQANMAAYFALAKPGDTLLAMSLNFGGHLTHGSPVNFSGKLFKIVPYGLKEGVETIDMDEVARLAKEHKPRGIVVGGSAYPRTLHFDRFAEIASSVGAAVVVDMAHIAGLVAGGPHPPPVPPG